MNYTVEFRLSGVGTVSATKLPLENVEKLIGLLIQHAKELEQAAEVAPQTTVMEKEL